MGVKLRAQEVRVGMQLGAQAVFFLARAQLCLRVCVFACVCVYIVIAQSSLIQAQV